MFGKSLTVAAVAVSMAFAHDFAYAGTVPLTDATLYKVVGGDEPEYGYKVDGDSGANFLRCDLTYIKVDEKRLVKSGGHCGDAKGVAQITVFKVADFQGDTARLTIVRSGSTALDAYSGQTFTLTSAQFRSSPLSAAVVAAGFSGAFATTDAHAVAIAISSRPF